MQIQSLSKDHITNAPIKKIEADLKAKLIEYSENEIPRSSTGIPKSTKSITRCQAIIDGVLSWIEGMGYQSYADLTKERMRDYFDGMIKDGSAPATIRKHRQIVNHFFKWSVSNHWCHESPMSLVANPKRDKSPPRFYSEDELSRIFAASKPPYTNIFKFLYLTGLRIGELGNAEWSHFLEDQALLRIPVMEGNKTKREEMLPINSAAMAILKEQRALTGKQRYIFLNGDNNKLDNANIYRALSKILDSQKIYDTHPHTFRHTCASHLVIKGVSLYIVKDILRHASIKETEVYAHLSKEASREAIEHLRV